MALRLGVLLGSQVEQHCALAIILACATTIGPTSIAYEALSLFVDLAYSLYLLLPRPRTISG